MKFTITMCVLFVFYFANAQSKDQVVQLGDRSTTNSQKYFDVNDPHFLTFFINQQSKGNKIKLLDSLVKKTPSYKSISKTEIDFFIDSIKEIIFKDTGKVCTAGETSIKNTNVFLPLSNYIFWINYKCWYKVGYHSKNTLEFANEFLVAEKIKNIAIVTPKKIIPNCMGKTIAHIYIFTKRRAKINYEIAGLKLKQNKLGSKWIGHN